MSQRCLFSILHNFAVLCTLFSSPAFTSDSKPSAVSVPIRSDWSGNDGFWSPVSVRVGTPPQWVELFPSTASPETWVVGPGGCDGTQQCFTERGGIFTWNQSSSWAPLGAYALDVDPQLGFEGNGVYGIDKIALSDTVSVPSQMVGIINSTDYWLGFFGLGVKPTNFTNADRKTFLDAMVENQSLIPSHSYGYTAGAHYRLKGVPGSLTLGGYDASRFVPQVQSFELDPNQNPVVAVNQITVTADPLPSSNVSTGWQGGSTDLLDHSQADLFTIDSSTPFLWLPQAVCSQFEKALNLTYDDSLDLYTFADNVTHQTLVNWNLSFAFTIADLPGSSKTVSLSLPYSAFDLQLSYPYPGLNITQYDPAVNYFPLRKAANTTQYYIGRSFLQETYLMVDYERNNFSIHPATFSIDPLQSMALVDISRPSNSTWSGPKTAKAPSLSTGATVGIAIAAIVGFAFLICLLVVVRKIRRDHPDNGYIRENGSEKSHRTSKSKSLKRLFGFEPPSHRTNPSGADRSASQAPGHPDPVEIGGSNLAFSPGPTSPGTELDSNDTGIRGFYEKDNRDSKIPHVVVNAIGHDPSRPVELPYRASNYRSSTREDVPHEGVPGNIHFSRPGLPTFAMVHKQPPTRQGTQKSMAVSSPSDNGHSSRDDSDPTHLVSPITPTREESPAFSSLDSIARRAAWFLSNESPSVSSESRGATERSPPGTMTIEERAGFPKNHSRHGTVSSMGQKSSTGAPSILDTISPQESAASHTRVPRNSRATAGLGRMESLMTWQSSNRSTVTNDIRQSVHRGFSWVPATHEPDMPPLAPRTPVTAGTEQSPYSPARWIEFWKTGRDPRLGPASDRKPST